ncbi:MAG: site-specific integrase [Actinobacteria bacterium]|nr:site-specific integrase [Actinomycetota bacterium]
MTARKASIVRAERISGRVKPNIERRAEAKAAQLKKKWTVAALWIEYQQANPGLKAYKDYNSLYNRYISPSFGDKQPKAILASELDQLKSQQLKGKSPQTVAHVLELLRRIINFGVKRGLCTGPGFVIQLPRLHNEKTEDLTPEQMRRLSEVINSHIDMRSPYRWGANMMRLALLTGMRRGEMFRLKWDDIDWHHKNILLREAKSGRDEIIPMSSYTEAHLRAIRDTEHSESPYIFPGKAGGPRSDIRQPVNHLKTEAGLPGDFRALHGLRHVFASGLISNGISKDVVARLLTHKGQTVTDRYAHIRDDALRHAAELAGQIVEDAGKP